MQNLNFASTNITPAGVAHLVRMSDSLTSLNLKDTRGFSAESIQALGSLKNLELLRINSIVSDPMNVDVGPEVRLLDQLRDEIPRLKISEY